MFITITLFFLAIAIAFAMLARKIWLVRSGRLIPGTYEETDWTTLSVESVRLRLLELFKFAVHYTVLIVLKIWIILSFIIKKCDKWIRAQLTHILHRNAKINTGEKQPSEFLQDMTNHKNSVSETIDTEKSDLV